MDDLNTSLAKKLEEFAKKIESTSKDLVEKRQVIRILKPDVQIAELKALKKQVKEHYKSFTKFREEINPQIELMIKDGLKNVKENWITFRKKWLES